MENKTSTNTNGETTENGNGVANFFARSKKVVRSPVRNQVHNPVPDGTTSQQQQPGVQLETPQMEQQRSQLGQSKLEDVQKVIDELYEYTKDRNNVHHVIKHLTVRIKNSIGAAAQEQQLLVMRAEKAEQALKEAVEKAVSKTNEETAPEKTIPQRQKKRRRSSEETPAKKLKDDCEKKNEESDEDPDPNEWKRVEKRRDRVKKKELPKPKKVRQKADALIVGINDGATYAEILRKVKSDPALKDLGANVARIRRTQNGEMLFELKKDPSIKSLAYKELVERSLGEAAKVRALSQEVVIECRNLDEITTEDELREALKKQFDLGDATLTIRMRKAFGETQAASIKLSVDVANKLLETGKVKVGWTVCSLRATQQVDRCYKCMGFGHQARNCKGPDRSGLCRRCGEKGHIAKDCVLTPRCLLCTKEEGNDHVTGGQRCPVFKKALAAKKGWR